MKLMPQRQYEQEIRIFVLWVTYHILNILHFYAEGYYFLLFFFHKPETSFSVLILQLLFIAKAYI